MTLFSARASAHVNDPADGYAWRDCHYGLIGRNIIVGYDTTYPFPAANLNDGVRNSFHDRLRDAVSVAGRWNTLIVQTGAVRENGTAVGMWYNGASYQDVRVRYEDVAGNGLTTRTFSTPSNLPVCDIHGRYNSTDPLESSDAIAVTTIAIDPRSDWFTQDDTRRSFWEGCPGRGDSTSYTCAKKVDAGSTFTHELGHAIGLADVNEVDGHVGNNSPTNQLATCNTKGVQGTMCNNPYQYDTARRTPDRYDIASVDRHYGVA